MFMQNIDELQQCVDAKQRWASAVCLCKTV